MRYAAKLSIPTHLISSTFIDFHYTPDNKNRRVLTCVQFSERAPVIVVGDNKGTVTVYRVMSPPLITHVGPLQQTEKLKHAVMGACDPAALQRLRESEKEESEKGAASVGLVAESTEAKEQM